MLKHFECSAFNMDRFITQCEDKYGPINISYLRRSLDIVFDTLAMYPRVYALRVDLRFANESPEDDSDTLICFQRTDSSVITRFMESLKSQLRADHQRQARRRTSTLPAFIWCREQDTSAYPHYHLMLLFNKDVYAFLGDYRDYGASNMGTRIQKAWCSALGLPYPDSATLVNFPENPQYRFDRKSASELDNNFSSFLFRIAYLSKKKTKQAGDGYRNFGTSQIIRVDS